VELGLLGLFLVVVLVLVVLHMGARAPRQRFARGLSIAAPDATPEPAAVA